MTTLPMSIVAPSVAGPQVLDLLTPEGYATALELAERIARRYDVSGEDIAQDIVLASLTNHATLTTVRLFGQWAHHRADHMRYEQLRDLPLGVKAEATVYHWKRETERTVILREELDAIPLRIRRIVLRMGDERMRPPTTAEYELVRRFRKAKREATATQLAQHKNVSTADASVSQLRDRLRDSAVRTVAARAKLGAKGINELETLARRLDFTDCKLVRDAMVIVMEAWKAYKVAKRAAKLAKA